MILKKILYVFVFSVVLFYASGSLFFLWQDYDSQRNYGKTYIFVPEGTDIEKIKEEYGKDIIILMPAPDPDRIYSDDVESKEGTFRDLSFRLKMDVIYSTAFGITALFLDDMSLLFASRQAYMTASFRLKCKKSETGHRIHEYIAIHPGCISSEIISDLKIGKGTLRYHLASDLNSSVHKINTDGKCYYFSKAAGLTEQEIFHIIHMKNDLKSQIYSRIDKNPGISVKELSAVLGQKPSAVRYHLKIMADSQEIRVRKEKNRETYYCMHESDIPVSDQIRDD